MWYRFEKGESKGKLRVKEVQIAWYDMECGGRCFDEDWFVSNNENKILEHIGKILPHVETVEDEDKLTRSRVFLHMDNNDVYELKMQKLSKEEFENCDEFYGNCE